MVYAICKISFLVLLIFAKYSLSAQSLPTEYLPLESKGKYSVGRQLEYYKDLQGTLTINEILSSKYANRFQKNEKDIAHFGISYATYWFRLAVENRSSKKISWLLEVTQPNLEYLEFFLVTPSGNIDKHVSTGSSLYRSNRDIKSHQFVFSLQPIQNRQIIYFKIKSRFAVTLPLVIWQQQAFFTENTRKVLWFGSYTGVLGVMILYNFFLFFSLKDKSYLYYVLFVGSILVFNLLNNGYYIYIWPFNPFYFHSTMISIMCILVFCTNFAMSFLNTLKNTPNYHRFLQKVNVAFVFITVMKLIFPTIKFIIALTAISCFVLVLSTSLYIYWKGYVPARYFVIACATFLSFACIDTATDVGLLPIDPIPDEHSRISIAGMISLFAFALADRIKLLHQTVEYQKEEYKTLLSNLNVGVYRNTGGTDGKFLQTNPAIVSMFGFSNVDEFQKANLNDLYADPSQRTQFWDMIEKEGECSNYKLKMKKKNGETLWVSINARAKFDDEGKLQWLDGVIEDISVEVQARKSLENMNLEILQTNTAYEKFVPSHFLRLLDKEHIKNVKLGDYVEKNMSILFSDIRSFATLSEGMSPEDNFNFINAYLSRVCPQVNRCGGFIDKYIGDAIMALFEKNADQAVDAGIAMLEALHEYNIYRQSKARQRISIGIGIHTGDLILGVIGESGRMEGTVIADAVNLASRIESLTKTYGASLLISSDTLEQLNFPENYHYRKLDRVKVKGKNIAIGVVEILNGNSQRIIDLKIATRDDFEMGIQLAADKQFQDAVAYFQKVLDKDPLDKAAKIHLNRATYCLQHGISPEWEESMSIEL